MSISHKVSERSLYKDIRAFRPRYQKTKNKLMRKIIKRVVTVLNEIPLIEVDR